MRTTASFLVSSQADRIRLLQSLADCALSSQLVALDKGNDGLIRRCERRYSCQMNGVPFIAWVDADHWFNIELVVASRDFDIHPFIRLVKDTLLSHSKETA